MTSPRLLSRIEHRSVDVSSFAFEAGHASDPVVHDSASLALLIEGSGELWMDRTHTVRQGDLFIVPEAAPHYMVRSHGGHGIGLSVCLACDTGPASAILRRVFEDVFHGRRSPVVTPPVEVFAWLIQVFGRIQAELVDPDAFAESVCQGLLMMIAVELERHAEPVVVAPPVNPTSLTGRSLAFIQQHATEPISLVDVARHVGRAPRHLATVVKGQTGRTVGDWIMTARMALARQCLRNSDDTIEVIAERSGFQSPSHFHRTFKRVHGLTPRAWRRLHDPAVTASEETSGPTPARSR